MREERRLDFSLREQELASVSEGIVIALAKLGFAMMRARRRQGSSVRRDDVELCMAYDFEPCSWSEL